MALTKEVKYDKIEIVGNYKAVQCRQATIVSEDGVELSRSFHRHTVAPDASAQRRQKYTTQGNRQCACCLSTEVFSLDVL